MIMFQLEKKKNNQGLLNKLKMLGLLRIGKTLNKIVTSDNYLHGTWKRNKEIETKEK